jgi:hypothetical protein
VGNSSNCLIYCCGFIIERGVSSGLTSTSNFEVILPFKLSPQN